MKKLIVFALCLIMTISCGMLVSAETVPTITLSNPMAMPGEEVTVDISISNNPGIMAMSFSIIYDNNVFEYVDYKNGYLSDYMLKDHTDEGRIAFVNAEKSDKNDNGIMLSLEFKIKESAALGKYNITIANQNRDKYGSKLHNSFSNSNMKYVVPNVVAGSITVEGKCEDVGHRYGNWTVVTPAGCNSLGEKKRICEKCGNPETDDIPFTHDFEDVWTVDKAATPTEQGIMSRHCKKCTAVTDELKFDYEDTNQGGTSSDQGSSSNNQGSSSNNQGSSSSNQSSSSSNQSSSSSNQSSSSSNQGSTSSNQTNSQGASASTNTTTSNEGSTADGNASNNSQNTQINNTVGSKNPLSAVENLKDYQENVKPDTGSSKHETANNSSIVSDDESQTSSVPSQDASDNTSSQTTNATQKEKATLTPTQITTLIIGAVLSLLIIIGAILLLLKRKKKQ